MAQGLTNREVAEQLFVSPHAVNTQRMRARRKLESALAQVGGGSRIGGGECLGCLRELVRDLDG